MESPRAKQPLQDQHSQEYYITLNDDLKEGYWRGNQRCNYTLVAGALNIHPMSLIDVDEEKRNGFTIITAAMVSCLQFQCIGRVVLPDDVTILSSSDGKLVVDKIILENVFPLKLWPKWQDREYCRFAVAQYGGCLEYVPVEWRNYEMCQQALNQSLDHIEHVPEGICTEEMWFQAVSQNHCMVEKVPPQFCTERVLFAALKNDGITLGCFKPECKTYNVCLEAVAQGGDPELPEAGVPLAYVPEALREEKEICRVAMERNHESLEFVPEHLRSLDWCRRAVQHDPAMIEFVPANLKPLL